MSDDIGIEMIDARSALGFIVLTEAEDGQLHGEIKSLAIDKLSAASMLYQMAKQLKALHDAEVAEAASIAPSSPDSGSTEEKNDD